MAQRLWRWCFVGSLCVVLLVMLLPSSGAQMLPGQDKLLHGITFILLYLIGSRAFPEPTNRIKLFGGLFGYGVTIELLQGLTGYRSMELLDAAADLAGLVAGLLWSLRKRGAGSCCG
ncbi:VanZ family protein [Porticoccus sp.]